MNYYAALNRELEESGELVGMEVLTPPALGAVPHTGHSVHYPGTRLSVKS